MTVRIGPRLERNAGRASSCFGAAVVTHARGEFFIEAGKVHEGSNGGSTPVKAVAVFVTDKGKPLTTQVK